jgi:hypothetical protein
MFCMFVSSVNHGCGQSSHRNRACNNEESLVNDDAQANVQPDKQSHILGIVFSILFSKRFHDSFPPCDKDEAALENTLVWNCYLLRRSCGDFRPTIER